MIWLGAILFSLVFILVFGLILSPPTKWVNKMGGDKKD